MDADTNSGLSEPSLKTMRNSPNVIAACLNTATPHAATFSLRQWPYWLAQSAFWGGYALLNMLFITLYVPYHPIYLLINIMLSLLLVTASHGLRWLYRRFGANKPLAHTVLHLIWLLPLTAISLQLLLRLLIRATVYLLPEWQQGLAPQNPGALIGYTVNTLIMLLLWTVLYLFISESRRRRHTELAYWQSQAALRDAELHFLRSQINSHFLFNALNNLRALIREDPELSRQRLTQLSTLLRAILQVDNSKQITVAEELDIVRGFVDLERLQYEDRLTVRWQVDDAALPAKMPPMLLQTLVENAVRHGIARRANGGVIDVGIERNNRLRIWIVNPLPEHTAESDGQGIGLNNTRQRLRHLYGDRATLLMQAKHDTMETIVEIPL